MLAHSRRLITGGLARTPAGCRLRYASTAGADVKYSPKVRAFRFKVTQDEAIQRAAPIVAQLSSPGANGYLTGLATRLLPRAASRPLTVEPSKVVALYVPGWLLDAEVDAKIWLVDQRGKQREFEHVTAFFKNSYMPGLEYDPISRMSFKDFTFEPVSNPLEGETVRWSKKLLHQCGSDVQPLPFTVSPFGLIEAAQKSLPRVAIVSKSFKIDTMSITGRFMAAFPMLMPVYVLQYAVPIEGEELTVIVDASRKKGRVIATSATSDSGLVQFNAGSSEAFDKMRFASVDRIFRIIDEHQHIRDFFAWLDSAVSKVGVLQRYRQLERSLRKAATGSEEIDWNDLRIREYTADEREHIEHYQLLCAEYARLRNSWKVIRSAIQHGEDIQIKNSTISFAIATAYRYYLTIDIPNESMERVTSPELFTLQVAHARNQAEIGLKTVAPDWHRAWQRQKGLSTAPQWNASPGKK